jgi:hypothetical protein
MSLRIAAVNSSRVVERSRADADSTSAAFASITGANASSSILRAKHSKNAVI